MFVVDKWKLCSFFRDKSKISSLFSVAFDTSFFLLTEKAITLNQIKTRNEGRANEQKEVPKETSRTIRFNKSWKTKKQSWKNFNRISPLHFAVLRWCPFQATHTNLLKTPPKTDGLFIRDYTIVRRLIPLGSLKDSELTFISDLPQQRELRLEGQAWKR